ncbi:MAG: hypothetical protein LBI13_00835 [Streptococcaceae bacterium]|jgi:hypothetical protein|nr:hypothetical protein [Streptococcaceae bacterium]
MGSFKIVPNMPKVEVIEEIKSRVTELELFVDTKKDHIMSIADTKIYFNRVLDFRVSGEEGFFGRSFSNQEILENGKFYEIENSEYIKYYLSMDPAAEAIYTKLTHYLLLDKIGNYGIDILFDKNEFNKNNPSVSQI